MIGIHDPLCEKEVSEESSDEQVLSEQPIENLSGERRPSDGIRYSGENPIELA
jgi:hypothetical protein